MKNIILIIAALIFAFSCGNKDDWEGPNGFGPLDGRFEINELRCSSGATPVQSRLLNFEPHDNGRMYVDFIESSVPQSIFKGRSAEGSYSRPDEREFDVTVSIDRCTFEIRGGFKEIDKFTGTWIDRCDGMEYNCEIRGTRKE